MILLEWVQGAMIGNWVKNLGLWLLPWLAFLYFGCKSGTQMDGDVTKQKAQALDANAQVPSPTAAPSAPATSPSSRP